MSSAPSITIDHARRFERLGRAPIVEATVEIRGRATSPWDEAELGPKLSGLLPEYTRSRHVAASWPGLSSQVAESGSASGSGAATPLESKRDWIGVQLEAPDRNRIALFARDRFLFSQLAPYESWEGFQSEGLRLWNVHVQLAQPAEMNRIGVRFINRLEVSDVAPFPEAFFAGFGRAPGGLPAAGFLYRDDLRVPGHPYVVKVLRTVQPPATDSSGPSLLLDIDAYCPVPSSIEGGTVEKRLADLRWLKNHVFFSSLTPAALDLCR